jgi:hypothetical protein
VLRKILGPKRQEITEDYRELHNEKLPDLHSSTNIIWVMESRRIHWVGHAACMVEK